LLLPCSSSCCGRAAFRGRPALRLCACLLIVIFWGLLLLLALLRTA
jgi:hypothetical protein